MCQYHDNVIAMTKNINFATTLKNLDGEPIKNEKGEPVLLNKLIANSLVSNECKGEDVLHRFELAMKINSAREEISISDSEQLMIKNALIQGGFTVLVSAQILKLFME